MGQRFWIVVTSVLAVVIVAASAEADPPAGCERASRISVVDTPPASYFGQAVAADGTTVMVGSPDHDFARGAVYVFEVVGSAWTLRQKLNPPEGLPPVLNFGASIAIDGRWAVIGATNGLSNPGAAYVFEFDGAQWVLRQRLSPEGLTNASFFGSAAAIDGDTMVVGTEFIGPGDNDVYIFRQNETIWSLQQKLEGSDGQDLGPVIATEGGQVFVATRSGSNYHNVQIYSFNGASWALTQTLNDPEAAFSFGESLAVRGDICAVGQTRDRLDEGRVLVYRKKGDAWQAEQKLFDETNGTPGYERLGNAVAIGAGFIVAASTTSSQGPNPGDNGTLVVFKHDGASWVTDRRIRVPKVSEEAALGRPLAASGDLILAAAFHDDGHCTGQPNCVKGAAWLFDVFDDDCNNNLIADACDLDEGAIDINANLTPDTCECPPAQKVTDAANDEYHLLIGWSVALQGDTAAVGALFDGDEWSGAVHVYGFDGISWTEQQVLVPFDADYDQFFGHSIAMSDNTMLVGAKYDDNANGDTAGAAYVFAFDGATWSEQQKLMAWDGAAGDWFGANRITFDGSYAAVPATMHDAAGTNTGAVYIFKHDGASWQPHQKLLLPEPYRSTHRLFGSTVDLAGDRLAVGCQVPYDSSATGVAFSYRLVDDQWSLELVINDPSPGMNNYFGSIVSLDGTRLAVSAMSGTGKTPTSGIVHLYDAVDGGWNLTQSIEPQPSAPGGTFGTAMDFDGDRLIVGAYRDSEMAYASGAAYRFERINGIWTQTAKFKAADAAAEDGFGNVVALSGDFALIGAYRDNNYQENSGAAYFIRGLAGDCNQNQSPDSCDISLGVSLDLNQNGVPDECEQIIGDADGDLDVDLADLLAVIAAWGPCPAPPKPCPVDFNRNGVVNVQDLLILISHWTS